MAQVNSITLYLSYVKSIEKVADRRQSIGKFFLALVTSIYAYLLLFYRINIFEIDLINSTILPSFLGLIICAMWYRYVKASKLLSEVKYELIKNIEKNFDNKLYTEELRMLNERGYNKLMTLEPSLPILFALSFLIIIFYSILTFPRIDEYFEVFLFSRGIEI